MLTSCTDNWINELVSLSKIPVLRPYGHIRIIDQADNLTENVHTHSGMLTWWNNDDGFVLMIILLTSHFKMIMKNADVQTAAISSLNTLVFDLVANETTTMMWVTRTRVLPRPLVVNERVTFDVR